jgi:FAD/FMN-containing dehydrogenase
MQVEVESWGRYPRSRSEMVVLNWRDQEIPFEQFGGSFLPYGMGRSYGDLCLNDGNAVIGTRGLDRVIEFDTQGGRLIAEAGITFDAILRLAAPRGWFLPVTPGTRFVTLGGAIANDVHGKNHHRAGTFGHHVIQFQLRRSDGSRILCSADENADWFRSTIGGLGLTGLIEWAEVRLKPIVNSWVDAQSVRFGGLDEFYALSTESFENYEYLVAWIDSLAVQRLGRGVFLRGNHNTDPSRTERLPGQEPKLTVPNVVPVNLLNRHALKAFNTAYYWARSAQGKTTAIHFAPFFYPLDAIGGWNRLYGPSGLLQWQALIPLSSRDATRQILDAAARSGSGSFLTVMKVMGGQPAAGLLSFSGRGLTIAFDFPNHAGTRKLLSRLDQIVAEAGGRLYPAKDAAMSGEHFRQFYPHWQELLPYIDPRFSSSFWRRVTES